MNIIKCIDIIHYQACIFMHKFHNKQLPIAFSDLFRQVSVTRNYNTRHAAKQSYVLPKVKTNYGLIMV